MFANKDDFIALDVLTWYLQVAEKLGYCAFGAAMSGIVLLSVKNTSFDCTYRFY